MITPTMYQFRLTCVLLLSLTFSGCATYSFQARSIRVALMSGQPELAYQHVLKQEKTSDEVLSSMNKGLLLRFQDDYVDSNQSLEVAKKHIEKLYGVSITDQVGGLLINEGMIAYKGANFEQLLLHAYMAMNYIQLGKLDAARVEMLQANVKMREWGDQPDDDPFIRYFSGMIYEALGEYDQALVAYRYAFKAYKNHRRRQALDIPENLKKDLVRLLDKVGLDDEIEALRKTQDMPASAVTQIKSKQGELIVIISNGLAPIKTENAITTFAQTIEKTVRITLPSYSIPPGRLSPVRIDIDGHSDSVETVENIDGMARSALSEDMPSIVTRSIARAVIKYNAQHKAGGNNSMGGLLMSMTNLVTERADTRSWTTLPQEIQMSRLVLNPGTFNLKINILNRGGYVIDQFNEVVTIVPGKISFVFKHWVAPRPMPVDKTKFSNKQLLKS